VLEQVIEKVGADYFFSPLVYDDPRWTSYRLAEVLPLEGEAKQSLLALRDDGERLERLLAYLRQTG
jgi:Lon protease-like protein